MDDADGVLIPQGIFEEINYQRAYGVGTYTNVRVDKGLLQERGKQVFNLIRECKWVCFLVGGIVDKVPQGDWNSQDINDSDLVKRMLNAIEITRFQRQVVDGLSLFETKRDEFRSYLRDYGIANTVFELPYIADDMNQITQASITYSAKAHAKSHAWIRRPAILDLWGCVRLVVTPRSYWHKNESDMVLKSVAGGSREFS